MSSPRDGATLTTREDPVSFQGMYPAPDVAISIEIRNAHNDEWDSIATTRTGTSATKDAKGTSWYYWSKTVSLPQLGEYAPQDSPYWDTVGNVPNRRAVASVRSRVGRNMLASFSPDADACVQENISLGGYGIIGACSSSQSPSATLSTPCGRLGASCCPDSVLSEGHGKCDFENYGGTQVCVSHIYTEIGANGQTTTQTARCEHCGAAGEPCCSRFMPASETGSYFNSTVNFCDAGNVCSASTCTPGPCGDEGMPCCTIVTGSPNGARDVALNCGVGLQCLGSQCYRVH